MDSVALWFEDDDRMEEWIERRRIRDKSNIMELSDKSFVKNFRVSKDAFSYILKCIEGELHTPCRQTAVPNIIKVSATLKFLAQGGYQHQIGQDRHLGLAQQTMSTVISEVCSAIEKVLCPKHINFVMTEEEKKAAKKQFFEKSGIPGVIGLVDGTHIQIIRPKKNEHLFFNRKLKHSINAMVICDHAMFIRAVNGRYGGASHDSHVWSLSEDRKYLKGNFENGDKSSWIIGDSGYSLEPWLLTPFRGPPDNSLESNFNDRLTIARSLIERTFGVIKARFRCLLSARELHYSPEKAAQYLNVCCALHNICLKYNVEMPAQIQIDAEDSTTSYDLNQHDIPQNVELSNTAKAIRNKIKNNLLRT